MVDDPLKEAFGSPTLKEFLTKERVQEGLGNLVKTFGLGADTTLSLLEGGIRGLMNPKIAPFVFNPVQATIAATSQGINPKDVIMEGVQEVAGEEFVLKPGQALTDYESMPAEDRALAERMQLLADPFIVAGPAAAGVKAGVKKGSQFASKLKDPAYVDEIMPNILKTDDTVPVAGAGAEVVKKMPEEFFTFVGSREKYINASPGLRRTQRRIYEEHLKLEEKYGDLPIWQKLMENYKANPISVDGRSYNNNVLQKIKHIDNYINTKNNKFSKSKPGLENVSMDDYVFPKDADGKLLGAANQTKFRQSVDDYQQFLSDRRRYESSYNKSKKPKDGETYDSISRTEANQQINWMLDNAKKNPDSVFEVVTITNKFGKKQRVGVLDTDSGITYYRDGFLEGNKLVKKLGGNLDPALHKSIINHPDFLETKKLFDARRTFSHTLPSDNIARQFDNYEFSGRPEEFRLMDKLSEYVTILERGADPATYPGFGKASMLDIHHTKGVGVEATDPRYLQLVERNANQRETVSAAFYNALKMGDTTEAALKIAAKEVKRFPGLRLDLRLPDGSFVRVGQKLSPEAAIKKHKQRMEKIINKYIKQDETFIDDFADFVGLKRKEELDNITESEMAMGMMGMGMKKGGRVGYKKGGTVKPKINPKDYIVNYSDGTKLYKINSFIRDIARQIDY